MVVFARRMPTIRSWLKSQQTQVDTKESKERLHATSTLGLLHLPETPLLPPKPAPRPAPRIAKLPLKLRVKTVRRGLHALEIDCIVTDAEGTSISYEPLTMNPKTTPTAAIAVLQHHVKCIAETMVKRNLASMEALSTPEEDEALIGMELLGSVAT